MIRAFKSTADLRAWLEKNHASSEGIWLRLHKKASGKRSITYAEALDELLCFGWIDGQKKPEDELSWLQRACPRRLGSNWSRVNTRHAERLIQSGRMTAPGLEAVEAAKADGRWSAAYDSPKDAAPPADFLEELAKDQIAQSFFETLNRANVYSIVYRLQTAKKPETRARRMKMILAMMARGEKLHP